MGKVRIGADACRSWLPRALTVLILAFSLLLASATEDGAWAHIEGGFDCVPLGGPFGVPGVLGPPDQVGEWGPSEAWPTIARHATLLHTGEVLWFVGTGTFGATTFLWDPVLNTHEVILAPIDDLLCSGHSTLDDGRVILIGGGGGGVPGFFSTLIFDPATDTWAEKADMACDRWYPTSTTLPDGRVLAMGGLSGFGGSCSTPEIYDVDTDTWTQLPALASNVSVYPYMFVQESGKVFYGGPWFGSGSPPSASLIDLDAQVWEEVDGTSFVSAYGSSAMYRPGKVIHAGGQNPALDKAEVIDLNDSVPNWRLVDSLEFARRRFMLVLLPDGTTLAVGGALSGQSTPECAVHAAELWDPDTELWTTMASHEQARLYHSVHLLLPDGRVLAAGGENSHNNSSRSAEIYSPPYLFKGPRPTITSAPSSVVYGETFSITTPDSASIDSVAFMRPASITHNFDQNQRYVPVNFVHQGTYLDVTAPANANLAPPGYYMVFLVDTTGVPSVAHFLRVGEPPPNDPGSNPGISVPSMGPWALGLLAALFIAASLHLLAARRSRPA